MTRREELATIARKAADVISQHGLAKTQLINADGAVCHNGALMIAAGLNLTTVFMQAALGFSQSFLQAQCDEQIRMIDAACISRLLRDGLGDRMKAPWLNNFVTWEGDTRDVYRTYVWNDHPSTTAEDVILLFKRVAEELEAA